MSKTIAIIGAGIAGTYLAKQLYEHGQTVTLFEKSRGTGGRLASCRLGETSANLGAQWLQARHPAFLRWLKQCDDVVAIKPLVKNFQGQEVTLPGEFFIAKQQLSSLTRKLTQDIELITQCRITTLLNQHNQWYCSDASGLTYGPFDQVVVTAPAPQAQALCIDITDIHMQLQSVKPSACWVHIMTLAKALPLMADMLLGQHPVFDCIISQQNAIDHTAACVFVQANKTWSEQHLDDTPEEISILLTTALKQLLSLQNLSPLAQRTHRWLYARQHGEIKQPFFYQHQSGLAVCGDAFMQGDIEGAWLSAHALAENL